MGDVANMQQLLDAMKRRIKWMKLMKDIIRPLYDEIANQNILRHQSHIKILEHIWKSHSEQSNRDHISDAKAEAENYIIAERKWIALKEIGRQCQTIEKDVSFLKEKGRLILQGSGRVAVASVVYASHYCENEIPDLRQARKMFRRWCGEGFEQKSELGMNVKPDIKNNLQGLRRVGSSERQEKIRKIARDNNMPEP